MKPRIFIGSSTEGLDIAYAIQQNLNPDANVTVWTQGIFQLSSNSLDDLLNALNDFDFGIFVFKPDDFIQMRADKFNVVRDNVIFELGMFIGRLGKERVYFVLPNEARNFHLPTDLLGVTAGKYDDKRHDNNLQAALGPFCTQVRHQIKNFIYESLVDLANESKKAKQIAIEKPLAWEFLLCSELLKSRLIEINRSYAELERGLVFQKSKTYDLAGFCDWIVRISEDIIKLISIFKKTFEIELVRAFGEPGVAGNIYEIKTSVDKIHSVCKELIAWEYELQSILPPEEGKEITALMKGWSKQIISEINRLPVLIDNSFTQSNIDEGNPINITLTFEEPANIDRITFLLDRLKEKY